jgi:membrane protein DedA with SNARE-associated domain
VVGEPETIPVVLAMALSSAIGASIGYYAGVAFGNLLT